MYVLIICVCIEIVTRLRADNSQWARDTENMLLRNCPTCLKVHLLFYLLYLLFIIYFIYLFILFIIIYFIYYFYLFIYFTISRRLSTVT
jgi:hypothetical protein